MTIINLFLGGLKIISKVLWFNLIFLDKDSEKFGRKLRLSLESMGPMFIKFGQLLSTRTDLLSINVAKELQKLTDQCKPCLLYTSPSPRDEAFSRMPSSA